MSRVFLTFIGTMICAQCFALGSSTNLIVDRILALNGRTGRLLTNLESKTSGACFVRVQRYSNVIAVNFDGTQMEFPPVANITDNSSALSQDVLLVTNSSERPGGDACGEWGGAVGYAQKIKVSPNRITIEEEFRCALEGFKKYHLLSACELSQN